MLLLLVASFLCDVVFIVVTRWILRWCSDAPTLSRISAMILVNCSLAALFTLGPLALPRNAKILVTTAKGFL
jgi:hypothetical protein